MKKLLCLFCTVSLIAGSFAFLFGQENENQPSFATPQETLETYKKAKEAENFQGVLDCMTPGLVEEKLEHTILGAAWLLLSTELQDMHDAEAESPDAEQLPEDVVAALEAHEAAHRRYNEIISTVREPLLNLLAKHGLNHKTIQNDLDELEEKRNQKRYVSNAESSHAIMKHFTGNGKDFLCDYTIIMQKISGQIDELQQEGSQPDESTVTPQVNMLDVRENNDRAVMTVKIRTQDTSSNHDGQSVHTRVENIPFRKIEDRWLLASEENEPFDVTPKKIAESDIPFSSEFAIDLGDIEFFELPTGKTFAFWGVSWLGVACGETPYNKPVTKTVNGENDTQNFVGNDRYIRQGSVITSSRTSGSTRVWFIEAYKIILDQEPGKPLQLCVEHASEEEQLTDETKRPYYINRLTSDSAEVRKEAIKELVEMTNMRSDFAGDPKENANAVRPLLNDLDPELAALAHDALRDFGDEQTLLKLLTPLNPKYATLWGGQRVSRWNHRQQLDSVFDKAMTFLASEDEGEYAFAIGFFRGEYPENEIIRNAILAAAKHPNPEIRAHVVDSLRYYTDVKQEAEMLRDILQNDKDEKVIFEALNAVERLTKDLDSELLVSFLKHADPDIRSRACYAVRGKIYDPIIKAAILEASHDENARVRADVANTIGYRGIKEGYDRLCEMLDDPEAIVRESAVYGLRQFDDPRMIDILKAMLAKEENPSVRKIIEETLDRVE